MKWIPFTISFIVSLCVGFFMAGDGLYSIGKRVGRDSIGIKDWKPRLPYRQFFKEERHTDSPISNIYIEQWTLHVETEDGNEDLIPLELEIRK